MQIDAHKRPLEEILKSGQHVIPRYQRRYAWEEQHIRDFWQDITTAPEQHFLGSMVVSGRGSAPREVIDGQQRLTTTVIALVALRDLYAEIGSDSKVLGIKTFIEFDDKDGNRQYRIKNKDGSADDRLRDSVLLEPSRRVAALHSGDDSREASAYSLFAELMRSYMACGDNAERQLDRVRDRILETEVVYISVEDRRSAFTIFETLNDRGQSLTTMDLVKNLLLSHVPASAAEHEDRAWSELIDFVSDSSLEGMNPDQFLYYYWNSRSSDSGASSDTIENSRIRRSVSDYIDLQENSEDASRSLIGHMHESARTLNALSSVLTTGGEPDAWRPLARSWRRDKYEEISERIYGVLVTGSNQPFPLLLSLLRSYHRAQRGISKAELVEFLQYVENFQFRWAIAQKSSTSSIRRLYRRAATAVDASEAPEDYRAAMKEFVEQSAKITPTDGQFKEGLAKLAYSNTRAKDLFKMRHVLRRVEGHVGDTRLQLAQHLSIEHLQGQAGRSESTPRNFWIFKLGNLMLLPGPVNANLPKDFVDKSSVLAEWVNPHDEALRCAIAEGAWGNAQYTKRQEWILECAVSIWGVPSLN